MKDDDEGKGFMGSQRENSKGQSLKTPVLDNFGRDLTNMLKMEVRSNRWTEKEIERVSQILSRRKKNNPIY